MFKPLSERQRRQWGNALIVLLAVCFLGAVWGTLVRVREGMDGTQEDLRKAGALTAEALDHELDIHVYNLLAMQYTAERFFSGRALGVENPITRLVDVPAQGGYQSVLPPEFGNPNHLGRFTGLGPIPQADDPVAAEMTMAIGLTPLMRAIRERSPDVPWVQYASARNFMFIFPYRGSEQFFFRPELLEREYFARAQPEVNPKRERFWSKPYDDAAGRGRIVTVTQPIYQGEVFRGSVSIDVLLTSLARRLGESPIQGAHLHLVDASGKTIVSANDAPDDTDSQPHLLVRLPLKSAPWAVELHIDQMNTLLNSLRARAWHIATVVVLGISLFFVISLTRKNRQIRELAIRDGLTGLYNRRHFDEVAAQQLDLARRRNLCVGLAILDIDYFKKYNDHYGHQEGDKALRAVARAAKGALRRGTDQIFRVGGEEFAVLLSLQQPAELEPLMRKLNQAVRDIRMPHAGNPTLHMTVSIGATAVHAGHWLDIEAAYRRADEGLYEAKTGGRDRAVVLA